MCPQELLREILCAIAITATLLALSPCQAEDISSFDITALEICQADNSPVMLLGTDNGIFRSENGGETWSASIVPQAMLGQHVYAFSPFWRDDVPILAAAYDGLSGYDLYTGREIDLNSRHHPEHHFFLYYSRDGGRHWQEGDRMAVMDAWYYKKNAFGVEWEDKLTFGLLEYERDSAIPIVRLWSDPTQDNHFTMQLRPAVKEFEPGLAWGTHLIVTMLYGTVLEYTAAEGKWVNKRERNPGMLLSGIDISGRDFIKTYAPGIPADWKLLINDEESIQKDIRNAFGKKTPVLIYSAVASVDKDKVNEETWILATSMGLYLNNYEKKKMTNSLSLLVGNQDARGVFHVIAASRSAMYAGPVGRGIWRFNKSNKAWEQVKGIVQASAPESVSVPAAVPTAPESPSTVVPVAPEPSSTTATGENSATGPSDGIVKAAIRALLKRQVPVSWAGSLMGGSNADIQDMQIVRRGPFNQRGGYWPVKVRVVGTCDAELMMRKERHAFDRVGDFKLIQDDYGDWQAFIEMME